MRNIKNKLFNQFDMTRDQIFQQVYVEISGHAINKVSSQIYVQIHNQVRDQIYIKIWDQTTNYITK